MFKHENRVSKSCNDGRNVHILVLFMFVVLVSTVLVLFIWDDGPMDSSSSNGATVQKWNGFGSLVQLDPTVEFRNGTDLIWQIPDSPKAVLFLAHGCNGRAANFFDPTSKCPNCVGLPEERLIALNALARKFAVLVVSSAGRCWSFGEERIIVKGIIKWWVQKQKLEKLPLVALGASSGGYFVSALATDIKFRSIVIMIAEGIFGRMDITNDYPPTLFVHMPKDQARKQKIDEYLGGLRKKGIDVKEIKCMEFPLSPSFFADRIQGVGPSVSIKLYNLLQDKGFIDKSGYMRNDGRAIHWKAALEEGKILLPHESLVNHIQEEMNLAFAYHEMTSLESKQIFDWFESHLS